MQSHVKNCTEKTIIIIDRFKTFLSKEWETLLAIEFYYFSCIFCMPKVLFSASAEFTIFAELQNWNSIKTPWWIHNGKVNISSARDIFEGGDLMTRYPQPLLKKKLWDRSQLNARWLMRVCIWDTHTKASNRKFAHK